MLISIVLSFRNEKETIPELIERLHNSLRPLNIEYEFIFVNDASTDNSLGILLEMQKNDRCIKIINMSRRFGVSQCVLAGMKYSKGDAVVYMDADLQDPPELIPEMIKKWKEGADVVYTTRITRSGENPIKMWITKMAYRFLRLFSEVDLPLDSDLKKWKEGADVVYTTRITRSGENPIKMWITKMAYRFLRLFSEVDLPLD